jgi:RHS repeat-associated protein
MTLPHGVSGTYNYDAVGRLTEMKYSKDSTVLRDLVYGYDEINRRTSYSGNTAPAPRDTVTDTATVNALNQYTTRNGKPVSHDDNANQTINNAVWDARDRLVSLNGPNFTASFTYDTMGRRSSKTVNGQTKTYHYDGADLISETGAEYTFGPGIDQPLERKYGQNEYYLSDALGSVIGLADGTGVIKTSYNYSPFGKKQTTGTASSNPFTFTGREDDGTGYYYYRARYYNPDQKRFISEDPLGFGGGDTNLQAYVGNNPVNFADPLGLRSPELDTLINMSCRAGQRGGACEFPNQSTAEIAALSKFNEITEGPSKYIDKPGFEYIINRSLKGGGSANLRPHGGVSSDGTTSGLYPTIDIKDHKTQGREKISEIKFKFLDDQAASCPLPRRIPTLFPEPSIPALRPIFLIP